MVALKTATAGAFERYLRAPGEQQAAQAVTELSEALMAFYRSRPSAGVTGSEIMTLYLDAQDTLVDHPSEALRLVREGLDLATRLPGGIPTSPLPARAGCRGSAYTDRRERRIVSSRVHGLLEKLYDRGVRLTVDPRGSGRGPKITGVPKMGLPAPLDAAFEEYREELSELCRWDAAEASSLVTEAHEFVSDRWRPGVREPAEAAVLWLSGLGAMTRKDMGGLRVALIKWVRSYAEEICRRNARPALYAVSTGGRHTGTVEDPDHLSRRLSNSSRRGAK